MSVVAEQTAAGTKLLSSAPVQTVSYLACDGGYIESGDPTAGEKPPSATAVARALRSALTTRGYAPAAEGIKPTLLLTYHWGVIRPGIIPHGPYAISPNLKARLMLVAPAALATEIETQLVQGGVKQGGIFSTMSGLRPALDNILTLANDAHYFVIISAYDHARLELGESKLLWRVKSRARGNSTGMDQALPALFAASAPYLGGGRDRAEFIKAPLPPLQSTEPDGRNHPMFATTPATEAEPANRAVRALLAQEHEAFSGQKASAWDELVLAGGGQSEL